MGLSVLAVLAIAFAVVTLCVVALFVRVLLQSLRQLTGAVRTVADRITPLTAELSSELAVTNTEVANLSAGLDQIRAERAASKRRRQGLRRSAAKPRGLPGRIPGQRSRQARRSVGRNRR